MAAQQNTARASDTFSFGPKLRQIGASVAAATQMVGGTLPAVSAGTSLVAPTAAVVGAAFLATTQKGDSAVVLASQVQQSLALGQQMAQNDLVRKVTFNIANGSINQVVGTSTPLGSMYSGISKHYFDYIQAASGSSNFTMSITTGIGQTVGIASYTIHPTLDFVLLQHSQPVVGATIPVFGTTARNETVTFVGYGNRHIYGREGFVNDGSPAAFNMRLISTSNSGNHLFSSSGAIGIAGGGEDFDSSAPGYNSSLQLNYFFDNKLNNIMGGTSGAGAIPFVESGLAGYIGNNTPLNSIPEPSSIGLAALTLLLAAMKRLRSS